MNIFVVSDTHGHLDKAIEMFHALSGMTPDGKPFDAIIHCGDYARDGESLGDELALPSYYVEGNCDGSHRKDHRVVDTPAGSILATHGHLERVDHEIVTLLYTAEEADCICACYGHTHVAEFHDYDGILVVNPGSLTHPRDGSSGSCAIINATESGLDGGIYYYDNICGQGKKKKYSGGFLRSIVNYSDSL